MDNYTQFLEETIREQARMINRLLDIIGGSNAGRSNTKDCEVGNHEIFASS